MNVLAKRKQSVKVYPLGKLMLHGFKNKSFSLLFMCRDSRFQQCICTKSSGAADSCAPVGVTGTVCASRKCKGL